MEVVEFGFIIRMLWVLPLEDVILAVLKPQEAFWYDWDVSVGA